MRSLANARLTCALATLLFLTAQGCSDDGDSMYMGYKRDSGMVSGDGSLYAGKRDAGAYADAASGDGGAAAPIPEEEYGKWIENDFIQTKTEAFSTFSIDVDTASYTMARASITGGALPTPTSIRVEEFINYFTYNYPQPSTGPFSINMEGAPSMFGKGYHLLRVGLQGRKLPKEDRKQANLVFLIDVSGSMNGSNRLDLVKYALTGLVGKLESTDTLGIVTYANTVTELLQPTAVKNKASITSAINSLFSSGSTAGGPGLQKAYAMAKGAYLKGGINRVILCTDGDFNVGISGQPLIDYVVKKRSEGITLSVLGFGMGNYKDSLLEMLTNKGNGNYAYIDNKSEADKVFGERLLSTLQVIAKDVKVQLQFNTKAVLKYRLVGYENRLLQKKDFKDDTKDAGEIGAGHSVTALYELELLPGLQQGDVLATTRFRYKEPEGTVSKELTRVIRAIEVGSSLAKASADMRFAAGVVEFAEILRHSKHSAGARFSDVISIITATAGQDTERKELVGLVGTAQKLWGTSSP